MENEMKYVVATSLLKTDGTSSCNMKALFSDEDKALSHLNWLKECAINNGATEIVGDKFSGEYQIPNGEVWSVKCSYTND